MLLGQHGHPKGVGMICICTPPEAESTEIEGSVFTLTMSRVMGEPCWLPVSMYLLRSISRNSNTRYNFWSACTISRSLSNPKMLKELC